MTSDSRNCNWYETKLLGEMFRQTELFSPREFWTVSSWKLLLGRYMFPSWNAPFLRGTCWFLGRFSQSLRSFCLDHQKKWCQLVCVIIFKIPRLDHSSDGKPSVANPLEIDDAKEIPVNRSEISMRIKHQNYTWRIIPLPKWLGSPPPFISHGRAIWKGSHNPRNT